MKSWFAGTASSVNSEIITPFSNAEQIIYKYNQAIEHNSLTQQGWQRLIAQCDDGLASYLTNIKGSIASMSAYSVSLQGNITGYTKITQAMKQYNALGAVSQKEQQNFATAVSLTNAKLGSYLTGLNGAKASLSGYGVSLIASTAKTVGLTIATTALNAALTFGISAIVTGVVSAFATWINSSKKITEAANEAKDKITSINDDLKTNTETVENAKQRYAELAQEVENLGKVNQSRGSLSTDEYKEFLDLSNQLAGVFPQLSKNYDENGNAILNLSGDVNTIVGSLDDLLQKEKDLANQKIMDEFPDVYKGYVQDLGKAESEVKSAKSEFDKINNAYQQLQNSGGMVQAFDKDSLLGTFENEDGEEATVELANYIQALEDLNIAYEKTNITRKNAYGGDEVTGYLITATGDIDTAFTSKLETARKNFEYAKQELESDKSSINSYLNTWLQSEYTYNQINDSGLQTAVQDMIMNFDFSNLPKDIDKDNWNEVSEYLRRNILFAINDVQDDPDISKAISEVFTNQDLTPDEKADYLKQIKDYFDNELGKDNAISIVLQPQIDDAEALQKSYENTINRFKDSDKIKDFFNTEGINTDAEIDEFNKVTESIKRADDAIQKWNEHKKEANEPPISFTDRLAKVQALSDGLDQLDKIYTDVLDGGDFDYSSILGNKDFTNTFSTYTAEYENFIKTISNSPTDINACQQAFNDLATAYIYNSNALKDVTDETKESTIAMLEQMGVQNAAIIVEQSLAANKILAKLDTIDFTNATKEEILALVEEENKVHNTNFSLSQLLAIKSNLNSLKIDTASDIEQLIALANAAGAAYMRIQQLENLKDVMTNNGVSTREKDLNLNRGGQMTVDEKRAQDTYNKLQDGSFWNADIGWMDLDASNYIKPVNYNGGSATDKTRDKKDKGSKDKAKEQEKAKEQTSQTFDLIETRIDRLESKISKFQKRAEDARRSFSSRMYNYRKEISTLFSKLSTQSKAYDRYMQKANSVGLSEEWKKKVRNGAISIKDVKDDTLKEQIESYQTWYEKAKKAKDATDDLTRSIQDEYEALAKLNSEYAENKIDKYSSSIDLLEAKKENYTKYTSKNNMLSKESSYLDKELSAYQKAYRDDKTGLNSATKSINKTKTTKANKKVLKEIKSCIKSKKEISSGILDRALSVDSNLYNQCVKYNAYLVAYETDKATYDLKKQENESKKADLAQEKMDNIDKYYSNKRQGYEQRAQKLNNAIDINEAKGYQISTKYYSKLVSEEKKNNASLVEERKKLVKSLADSLKNGSVKMYSDEWYEMSKQIDDITNSIDESTKSLVEYKNQLRQIKWDNFDYLEERIKTVTSEIDFMINELSREDLTSDDTGDFTDRGKAVAYLHASNYTAYLNQAKDYEKEVSKIEKELAKDPYNKTLIERKEELVKSYQDAISAAQEEKYAIIDLYTQGYEAMKNHIADLISEYEKLMDAEKNAYDWQNTVAEKTKQIADLRKQLLAYSGDMSEESRVKIQSLTVSLKDSEKDLRESQYEKFISDSKDMLSDLQDNFDDVIQDVIDSLSEHFDKLLNGISSTSNTAVRIIKEQMKGVGYTSTNEFSQILNGTNVVTATNNLIVTIKEFQSKMIENANKLADSTSTTTGAQSAKDSIRSEGAKTLSKAVSSSQSATAIQKTKIANAKLSRDEAKLNRDNLKKQYKDYIKTHKKNSSKAKELKDKYDTANSNYNELNKSYNIQNAIYKDMKKQNDALNYLQKHLDVTDSSRDKLSDLNKALYDKYGQRILSESEMKELAKLLGVKFDNKNKSGNLYKKLKEIGVPGFKVGSRNIPKDMLAVLGEEGNELHFSKEQGILKEVGQGDKIFTNEQAQNLWKLSQLTPVDWSKNLNLSNLNIPQTDRNTTTIVEVGDIVMNGVNDKETFAKELRNEICKGGKTTKCIAEVASSSMLGKGIGKAKLYR